jgi:hypothetical protein
VIEQALYKILADDSGVGALAGDRVYPIGVPQDGALPAVTYQQIAGPRDRTFDGATGLVDGYYQVTCWAATYGAAKGLSEAVRAALDDYAGTVSSVWIRVIRVTNEMDIPVLEPESLTQTKYGKALDIEVTYHET